jgi:hypothetical protein
MRRRGRLIFQLASINIESEKGFVHCQAFLL